MSNTRIAAAPLPEPQETKMDHPIPTAMQPKLDPDTAYRTEDEFHDGKALLAQALAAVLTEDAGFPAEIVRRGRTYALAGVKLRHDRIMEDLAYIREYLRQCSKSIDWPAGRLLG